MGRTKGESSENPGAHASDWVPFTGEHLTFRTEKQQPSPNRRGLLWNPIRGRNRREPGYRAKVKAMEKVLDFIQFGGPDLTVDSTIFEMWMGL